MKPALSDIFTYELGLSKEDEHSAYAPEWVWRTLPSPTLSTVTIEFLEVGSEFTYSVLL